MKRSPLYYKSGMGVASQGSPIQLYSIAAKVIKHGISYFTKSAPKVAKTVKKTKQIGHKPTLQITEPDKFVRHSDPSLSHNIMKAIDLSKKHTGKGQRNLVWFGKGSAHGYKYPGRETFTANFSFKNPVHFPTNRVFKNEELKSLLQKGHDVVIMGKGENAHYMPLNKNIIKNLTKQ
tara:strand:- start:767 stop:1297 length:531 start_codon:yes stop_codon:yes gene_type:complete